MKPSRRPGSFAAALCLLAAAAPLSAQHLTRTLTGTVTDHQHEPLRGAVVEVHSDLSGNVVSFITTQTGQYSFKRLEADIDYTVSATWHGHKSATRKLSLFDTATSKVIDLEVQLGP